MFGLDVTQCSNPACLVYGYGEPTLPRVWAWGPILVHLGHELVAEVNELWLIHQAVPAAVHLLH